MRKIKVNLIKNTSIKWKYVLVILDHRDLMADPEYYEFQDMTIDDAVDAAFAAESIELGSAIHDEHHVRTLTSRVPFDVVYNKHHNY